MNPAFIAFSECPIPGGACNTVTINESVDVVASLPTAVPVSTSRANGVGDAHAFISIIFNVTFRLASFSQTPQSAELFT